MIATSPRTAFFALVALLASALAACGDEKPATQVMVVIDAEAAVRQNSQSLTIEVFGSSRDVDIPDQSVLEQSFDVTGQLEAWPIFISLAPQGGDTSRIYRVVGRALSGPNGQGDQIAEVRAISGYRPDRALEIRLMLQEFCIQGPDCADDESCVQGTCESAFYNADTLTNWSPGSADGGTQGGGDDCDADEDCDDGIECTVDRCVENECSHWPDRNRCDDLNECTDNLCTPDGCAFVSNEAACHDGNFCNGEDTCGGGSCSVHSGSPCGDANGCDEVQGICSSCTLDEDCGGAAEGAWSECDWEGPCDPEASRLREVRTFKCAAGACEIDSSVVEEEVCERDRDGNPCDDMDRCTENDRCLREDCMGDFELCDDGNACTSGQCDGNTGLCNYQSMCQSGQLCDPTNGCFDSNCSTNAQCDDGDPCTDDRCDGINCSWTPVDCGSNAYCDSASGQCTPWDPCQGVFCDDYIFCTHDMCNATGGCDFFPDDTMCNPGTVCRPSQGGCVLQVCMDNNDCNDFDPCTQDWCAPGDPRADPLGCVHNYQPSFCGGSADAGV